MKTSFLRSTLRVAFISAALSFSSPVFADNPDMLTKALDLVHHAENLAGNPPSDAERIDLLTQAIKMAQQAPNHRLKGHRVLAIQDIRVAIAAIQGGDADHKAVGYIRQADTELSAAASLAKTAESSTKLQEISTSPAPPTSMAPPSTLPPVPAPVAVGSGDAALPPGVTPEMEQAFLAKYKAALDKQDPDAYMALVANDPHMDPKAREDMKGLELFGLALATSNPNRTYSFVPVASDQQDKPEESDGKMYGAYLPAVVAMKIAFGKPPQSSSNQGVAVGDHITPLCIKDHQLMMVGAKEIPGTVPPDEKTKNFGIKPNKRKIETDAEFENASNFASLNEFISALKQPSVEVIASGETDLAYYAICRVRPNLFIYANADRTGKDVSGNTTRLRDSDEQEIKQEPSYVWLSEPGIQGTVFRIPGSYAGPLTLETRYFYDTGTKSISSSRTIDWK